MLHIYASDMVTKLPVFYITETSNSVIKALRRAKESAKYPVNVQIFNKSNFKVYNGKVYNG